MISNESEENPKEILPAQLVMFRKVREDCSEGTDAQRSVARDREVVLARPLCSQAKVAPGLACHLVSKAA